MKRNVLWMNVLLGLMLILATDLGHAQMTVMAGRASNEYTAAVTPTVVAQTGQAIPFSLMLMNVTPARDSSCGDDHDDGGCGDDHDDGSCDDDHDDGGCGDDHEDGSCGEDHDDGSCSENPDDGGCDDDHDDGSCGDDHDDGGCGDDHEDGGCSGESTEPGSMAIKKITLWLPEGITTANLHNIGYYTMPCGRQWTRKEPEATDRIVFVAEHGRAHRLGRDQAFVLTFDLHTPFTGELQWVTELSQCPGNGGRLFQLVTMPDHQYTDAHPTTLFYTPDNDMLAGGGIIVTTQSHGSHAQADGTPLNFEMNAKVLRRHNNIELRGQILFSYLDAMGTRWFFQSTQILAMGINRIFDPRAPQAWFATYGRLSDGNTVLYDVMLQANMADGGVTGKGDKLAFTLRQHDILLLSTHWLDKATITQPITRGNLNIFGGATPDNMMALKSDAFPLMPQEVSPLQFTAYPNPFCEELHFRFTPSEDTPVLLQLFDIRGRMIATLMNINARAGEILELNYIPQTENPGIVVYRLITGEQVHSGKVMYQK